MKPEKKKKILENSKVTSLGKPEVQGFIVLTSRLKSMKQKMYLFNNFYLYNILLGSGGKQRHRSDIVEFELTW